MLLVYCLYNYVNNYEARSSFLYSLQNICVKLNVPKQRLPRAQSTHTMDSDRSFSYVGRPQPNVNYNAVEMTKQLFLYKIMLK